MEESLRTMRTPFRFAVALALTGALVAACSGGASPTPAPSAAPPSAAAPSAAPSIAATPAAPPSAAVVPSPSPDPCAPANLKLVTAGKITVGTDNPAYPPYFQPPASGDAPKPWQLGDPTNGQGFESAFAYALAAKLGFAKDAVTWIVVPFDTSYAPGAKKFDLDINQVSYTPDRASVVDMSDGYYFLSQAVVALKTSPLAKVTSIAGLKSFKFGAQQGTTSYDTIVNVIQPAAKPSVYSSNDDAISALKAKQIDGLVVDLPTAFYATAAQITDAKGNGLANIVGQFPVQAGAAAEHFSAVLAKGNPLTACVNQAIAALKADGTLDQITKEWLADKASAPIFGP
jgi:polar amino acid transport system substrate-binding protein